MDPKKTISKTRKWGRFIWTSNGLSEDYIAIREKRWRETKVPEAAPPVCWGQPLASLLLSQQGRLSAFRLLVFRYRAAVDAVADALASVVAVACVSVASAAFAADAAAPSAAFERRSPGAAAPFDALGPASAGASAAADPAWHTSFAAAVDTSGRDSDFPYSAGLRAQPVEGPWGEPQSHYGH